MSSHQQRKYALSKVAAGDYLLPSNDAKTIWRIHRHTEGPSSGIEDWPSDREVWGLWRWSEPFDIGGYIDTADWSRWEFIEGPHLTRSEATRRAIEMS